MSRIRLSAALLSSTVCLFVLTNTFGEEKASDLRTVIYIVRHAEKAVDVDRKDPPLTPEGEDRAHQLSQVLRSVELKAIYATELKRTQETVKPIATRTGIVPTILERRKTQELTTRLTQDHRGDAVLVSGHSFSIPQLMKALGVEERISFARSDYDQLFVVIHEQGQAPLLLRLHYSPFTPSYRSS